ncbi:hypothetical protein GOV13_01950 [Candidatus Pacearchaeota archaeon]|nr:hypothetical protein [Candidatus Pacearchaeota archaeon]
MSLSEQETKGIRAVMILEVLGKPPKHLNETLENLIKQIDEEKHVEVKRKRISEAKKLEDSTKNLKNFDKDQMTSIKGFYTNFAEVEVEVEDILNLVILMFKYMPAHIEIVSPELIALTNNGWGDIMNELVRRLHGYDEIARVLQVERTMLENKLKEVMGEEEFEKMKGK